nr:hypothetical protein [Tanacetum cinerariifolium]
MSLLQEALDSYAALTRRVEHLEYDKVAQALEIKKPKQRVKKIEKGNRVKLLKMRRLKRVDKMEEKAKVVEDDQVQGRQPESQAEIYKIDLDHASKVLKVVTAASETITAASTIISAAEPQVAAATITAAPIRVVAASTRRRKGVVIRDQEEESTTSSIIPTDTKSKDKGKGIMVEEPKPLWDTTIDHVKQKT